MPNSSRPRRNPRPDLSCLPPVLPSLRPDLTAVLPPEYYDLLPHLPVRVSREDAAVLLTRYFFATKPRTLERAPLCWQVLNGRAHCLTIELFAWAAGCVADAPALLGGHCNEANKSGDAEIRRHQRGTTECSGNTQRLVESQPPAPIGAKSAA